MSLHAFRLKFATLLASLALVSCGGGGSSAPAPTHVKVDPGDGQVTLTWDATPGVEYWLAYAAADSVSTASGTPHIWASMSGLTSPYVLSNLTNGTTYSFSLNGRIDGGPGGAGSPSISTVPRPGGQTWAAGDATSDRALRSVAYSLISTTTTSTSTYLAVGDGGAMYQCSDGKSWTAVSSAPTGVNFTSAIYSLGQYIVVGSSGKTYYSTDLSSWMAGTSGTSNALNAVASNGALAVAVGDAGTIVYSNNNGISWTAIDTSTLLPGAPNLYGVTYSGSGIWLAVGASGTLLTSTDGSSWTSVSTGTTQTLRSVASTALRSVVASTSGIYSHAIVGDAGTVLTGSSADNTLWTLRNVGTGINLTAVVGSASQFLAVGDSGVVYTSTDGSTWAPPSSSPVTVTTPVANWHGLVFAQAQYVAVGDSGQNSNSH